MRDRTFGPTVLLGLAAATLTSVAAGRDWSNAEGEAAGVDVVASAPGSEAAPLALALALVALAAWGVVLVLRGRARRYTALVGLVAAIGVVAAVVGGYDGARDAAVEAVTSQGATGDGAATSLTVWYWATGLGAILTAATLAVAVRRAPTWPAMGSRYDAPATRAEEPASERDLWRALDDGHDPTA